MTELIVISGVYLTPDGKPFSDVRLCVTLRGNTSNSFRKLNAVQITDVYGNYKFELLPGEYDVAALYSNGKSEILGTIQLLEGSQSASLNDYLIAYQPGPNLLSEMTRLLQTMQIAANTSSSAVISSTLSAESSKLYSDISEQSSAAAAEHEKNSSENKVHAATSALEAKAEAARAKISADKAENIADANTYYITATDPDGTIAGLAGTPNGQSFRVAQGPTKGFRYYRNDSGTAVEIAAVAGEAAIAAVIAAQAFINSIFPQSLAIAAAGWMWGVSEIDGMQLFAGIDSTGGLKLCDMPDAVQDRLRALADYETTSRTPGYHHVFRDRDGLSGAALSDDWGLMLADLDKSVQDEINDLKVGIGSAILRPHNGLLAVFKDADSTTPVYAVNPVAYASKLASGGASIVYDDAGTVSTGTLNLREPQPQNSNRWGYVQRPIPSHVSQVFFRQGLGQSLMVGGGVRVTPVDQNLLGLALTFMGAGADRGVGYPDDGPVSNDNLSVFMDARSIGEARENCMTPGTHRFLNDMMNFYSVDKRELPAVVTRMDAKSGTAISGLKKGTAVYADGQAAFTSFVERVIEQGKIPVINSFFITHGEEDSKTVTAVSQYQAPLSELISDKQTDTLAVLAAHGVNQVDKPLAYIDQVGSLGKTVAKRGDLIAYAQLAISNERPDVILSTPKFHLNRKYHIDDLHLTGQGYAVMGEYQGQAEAFMYKERVAGTNNKWVPVQPLSVVKSGLNYDVTFSSPFGLPLKINTKYGTAPNLGADLENGTAKVVAASQISDFVFRFTLDAEPVAGEYLRFGFNATDTTYCLVCISDTSTRISRSDSSFILENFCCLSRIAIS